MTNTALVALVTESRILYGMAREGVVPRGFARVHHSLRSPWVALIFSAVVVVALLVTPAPIERLAAVTVVFTLFIYGLVIIATLKLRGDADDADDDEHYTAPTALLYAGLVGNAGLLVYTVLLDPGSLIYCAGLLGLGLVLYLLNRFTGGGAVPSDRTAGSPAGGENR